MTPYEKLRQTVAPWVQLPERRPPVMATLTSPRGSMGEEVVCEIVQVGNPRIGTYYCCAKAVGTGRQVCEDCEATSAAFNTPWFD